MYRVYGTKKLLDRIKVSLTLDDSPPTTMLGNWYASALFWKPQLALLVNERTLLPVLMPLAPAADLVARFPQHLSGVLSAHGIAQFFIDYELSQMSQVQYGKNLEPERGRDHEPVFVSSGRLPRLSRNE